ncbi:MAG: VCBS repeat-containing protein [Bacteroidetes bacterium]|nr:MAG: VCBS repeat-containing protein [Bacteroidota bacterium]
MSCHLSASPTLLLLVLLTACAELPPSEPAPVSFKAVSISQEADLWWARTLADINQDGLVDVVLQHRNGAGGWLGWLEATTDTTRAWTVHVIADSLEDGRRFAAGDLDLGDLDGDGDPDVIGVVHPGEWTDADAPADLFWFENPSWTRRPIGQIPDALKDINLADFNGDGRLDIVTITFEENVLTIFQQQADGTFRVAHQTVLDNLHEGMDVGDLDGDGDPDIATNGYWLENGSPSAAWTVHVIDSIWHNQTGDWSRNATKVAVADLEADPRPEVLIAHSERTGYPLALYRLDDAGAWHKTILLDSIPAAHSLQVADFNGDGRPDILTGVNRSRAVNLGLNDFPVYLMMNHEDGWDTLRIHSDGIYNAQVADFDGDGDPDIFRYPTHDATTFEVLVNQTH